MPESDSPTKTAEKQIAHTPGPWSADSLIVAVFADNPYKNGPMKVCDIRGWGHLTGTGGGLGLDEDAALAIQTANARLIAAAPDLLTAAKKALEVAESWIHDQLDGTSSLHSELNELTEVRQVIAKAEGVSHHG